MPAKKNPFGLQGNSKMTPEVIEKICNSIQAGNHVIPSIMCSGVSVQIYYYWRNKGNLALEEVGDGDPKLHKDYPYIHFVERLAEAEAKCEVALVAIWRKQCPEDWRAAQAMLALRFSKRWAKNETINVNLKTDFNIIEPEPPEDTEGAGVDGDE